MQDVPVKRKGLALLSGGLDSVLATKIIMDQGIDLVAVHFTSPFQSRKERERGLQAIRSAEELSVPLRFVEKGEDFLQVVKNPRHGYGKNMNPCIDCRIYMLRIVRGMMDSEEASFVVTGEVVGQRPMSQMRDTIGVIEKESGLEDQIVRPLSAALFAPSKAEREGIVDRTRLLGISGRSRKEQNRLAQEYGLKEFGHPAGGCLLTDPIFAVRLKELIGAQGEELAMRDVEMLSVGRHFRLNSGVKVVVGRNKEENEKLEALPVAGTIFRPVGFKGPVAVALGKVDGGGIAIIANILAYFSKKSDEPIVVESADGGGKHHSVPRLDIDIRQYLI